MFKKRKGKVKSALPEAAKSLFEDEAGETQLEIPKESEPKVVESDDNKDGTRPISTDLSNAAKEAATKVDRLQDEVNKEILELKQSEKSTPTLGEGVYKGSADYATFVRGKTVQKGLNRNSANIMATTVVDLQPDVCKDYKQHGYCGFGDTCKFLHIRDEFKKTEIGEREWETVAKTKGGRVGKVKKKTIKLQKLI